MTYVYCFLSFLVGVCVGFIWMYIEYKKVNNRINSLASTVDQVKKII
jgi:uncharacterized membrane-anchored protein YhcB (DUF1043 family)